MSKADKPELPTSLPGHWDTLEGCFIAQDYAGKERSDLCMGDVSDLALANRQFLASRHDLDLIAYQTAAKERIRWLSAQLAIAHAALRGALGALEQDFDTGVDYGDADWEGIARQRLDAAKAALKYAAPEVPA